MKKALITAFLISTAFLTFSQATDTTYWRKGGNSSLTFSQVSLTNWAAGGQNSASINGNFGVFANRIKGRGKWQNSLDIAYGLIKQGTGDFDKSDDMINLVTKYGYRIVNGNEKWFFSALLDFRTQFDEGFDAADDSTLISDFMAPGYLVFGLGATYDPNKKLSISYQPITGKFTFVGVQALADNGDYGVDPATFDEFGNKLTDGKNARAEIGSFFRAKYITDVFESRLELFTNYVENFGNVDVNWQNALTVNFTKVLSTNFFTQLLYDDDITIGADDNGDGEIVAADGEVKQRVQWKSVIGVGLTYKFGVKRE